MNKNKLRNCYRLEAVLLFLPCQLFAIIFYLMGYDNKHTVKSLPAEKVCVFRLTLDNNLESLVWVLKEVLTTFLKKKNISGKRFSLPSIAVYI